jgi:hypothetical protein
MHTCSRGTQYVLLQHINTLLDSVLVGRFSALFYPLLGLDPFLLFPFFIDPSYLRVRTVVFFLAVFPKCLSFTVLSDLSCCMFFS